MQAIGLPDHMQGFAAAHPDVTIQTSITVDPLVLDELQREVAAYPIVRVMERMKFQSENEANRYLQNLVFRSSSKDRLDTTEEEQRSDNARALVSKAFLSTDRTEQQAKAEEALSLSAQCAEAYIILAGLVTDLDKRIELLEKGTGIACLQFDCSRFEDPKGYFWQKLATRPYMRCRTALAIALWESSRKESAINHFKTLLKFNPGDNQGLRFHLLNWLLDHDASDPTVDEYCNEYEQDRSAFVKYACALWQFIRYGNGKQSLKALSKATDVNKFVPALLCSRTEIPTFKVARAVRGTVPEAVAHYRIGGNAWRKTDGAISWLTDNCSSLLSSKTLLRKIESAEEYKLDGPWAGPMPMELSIAHNTVWR